MIPVFNRTKAMDEMIFLFGSHALYPQTSSLSNPLPGQLSQSSTTNSRHSPHAKHIDQVLFCHIVLLAHIPLQSRKDSLALSERFPTTPL
jgi:hypothetical protein